MSAKEAGAEQVLRELRMPEKLAPLVTGETPDEQAESARKIARELNIQAAPPEQVMLARRALAHAEWVRRMHGVDAEDEPEQPDPDAVPDFDGGVREPAPMPSDPMEDHNQTMVELARMWQSGMPFGGEL